MKRFLARLSMLALLGLLVCRAQAQQAPAASAAGSAAASTPAAADDDVEITTSSSPTPAPAPVQPTAASAVPAATTAAPAAAVTAPTVSQATAASDAASQRLARLEQHEAELEAKLEALEKAAATQPAAAAPAGAVSDPWLGIKLSGFVQAQYEANQASQDQLLQSGAGANKDRFLVRRGRLRLDRSWQYTALALELDANTARGLTVSPRRAEASVFWPGPSADAPPYIEATLGLQDIPFGYELPYGSKNRIFAERSLASTAFFPSEPDVGVVFHGGLGPVRYALAALNGQPLDERTTAALVEPNAAKDVLGRVGIEARPEDWLSVAGGASFLSGTGFHAGNAATKNSLQWSDQNEDSAVASTEIMAVPGSAALRSRNFKRWAAGVDAELGLRTTLGWSRLYGEVTLASNLDRGLFVADPYATSDESSTRELGYYVAWTQEVTRYGLLGFRTDFYDGNSDFTDSRRGKILPAKQSIRTFSPLIGVVLPDRARLVLQYDFVRDALARDKRGVPTDLRNNQWTLRLQVGI